MTNEVVIAAAKRIGLPSVTLGPELIEELRRGLGINLRVQGTQCDRPFRPEPHAICGKARTGKRPDMSAAATVRPVIARGCFRFYRAQPAPVIGELTSEEKHFIDFLVRQAVCAVGDVKKPRTALYARYSSDKQSESSIEDQLRLSIRLSIRLTGLRGI